jgi:hypothetical protein
MELATGVAYVGRKASTRWASGRNLSMMTEAGDLDPVDENFPRVRKSSRDPKYLDEIRAAARQASKTEKIPSSHMLSES